MKQRGIIIILELAFIEKYCKI